MFSINPRNNAKPGEFDERITSAARNLKVRELPSALRENTVTAFQQRAPQTTPLAPHRSRRLIIGIATVAAVGVVAVVSGPRFATPPVSAAAIVDAIQSTNTWHLVGWRLQNGKKVRWEVWGRRAPFFYREQIGDEIVTDDGNTRIHLLPPQRMHRRGMLLVMPSRPLHTKPSEPQLQTAAYDTSAFLDGTSGDYLHRFTVKTNGNGPIVLEGGDVHWGEVGEQVRITADRKTRLPEAYEVIRSHYTEAEPPARAVKTKAWRKALLRAHYDVAIPRAVLQEGQTLTAKTAEYQTIDFAGTPDTPTGTRYGMARKNGITVVGEVMNRDEEGNLRLKYQVWLGDVKTGTEASQLYPSLMFDYFNTDVPAGEKNQNKYPVDNRGVVYLRLNEPDADTGGRLKDYRLGYFANAEPNRVRASMKSETLTLPLRVRINVFEDDAEQGTTMRTVAEEELSLTVPLPATISSLGYDRPRPQMPGLNWKRAGAQMTLRLVAAWQRGIYWSMYDKHLDKPLDVVNRVYLERAKGEFLVALEEAERTKDKSLIDGMRLNLKSTEDRLSGRR